jgi:HNH endonuclease
MPEVKVNIKTRASITKRANGCCEYCQSQEKYSPDPFSVEHIFPLSKGGSHTTDNLALACQGCNNHKYTATEATDLATGQSVSLFHPREDGWLEHFAWNEDASLLVGLTPVGRATLERLQLNRVGVVNLRRVLFSLHLHPPDVMSG